MGVHTEAVQQLYVAYFSRPADPAGLAYWEQMLARPGSSVAGIAEAFAASHEYRTVFQGLDEQGIVDLIYHNLFGRGAEPAGLAYWADGLKQKQFTIAEAVTTIARGAQGADKTAFDNKVKAATAFTGALDVDEIIAYTGELANGQLQKWLSGITTDGSLETALTGLDAFVDAFANGRWDRTAGMFERVEVRYLTASYDADLLASHKQAIEFVASRAMRDHSIKDMAPSASLRITGDLDFTTLTLAQKLPGALKIHIGDYPGSAARLDDDLAATVIATNATALNVAFSTDFVFDGPAADDRQRTAKLDLTGQAETLSIASGGTGVFSNVLSYHNVDGMLRSITVTGGQALRLETTDTFGLRVIDATQHLGGLTVSTAVLNDEGWVKLGAGKDVIEVAAPEDPALGMIRSIHFFEKGTAQESDGDLLVLPAGTRVADATVRLAGATLSSSGVLTFSELPMSVEAAYRFAEAAAETKGEAVVFTWLGNSYLFVQGGDDDRRVRLVGIDEVEGLAEAVDSGSFYLY